MTETAQQRAESCPHNKTIADLAAAAAEHGRVLAAQTTDLALLHQELAQLRDQLQDGQRRLEKLLTNGPLSELKTQQAVISERTRENAEELTDLRQEHKRIVERARVLEMGFWRLVGVLTGTGVLSGTTGAVAALVATRAFGG